ncbi:mitofusin [Elasticomyces elasticus]|uniref:Mitofusin n=1 Tax=Exophiala sideris TaxID=1016849 RepID=A0ABR0J1P0_9EURO|nr:mitofusin [Elasticomyces elasticus]KAK5024637.1 mitofusin [Exophiala sideris]KAK5030730.1 mitofusin [Exophiala sideris]KAK5054270.1 mitofusin [Exophiala sideris]KAK5179672.1 mitofusin [Eurotiomycetes sp. CCFEE 6388]
MSQSYFPSAGSSRKPQENGSDHNNDDMASPAPIHPPSYRPEYMTVGSGGQSMHAAALMEQLEQDSGYGSMPGDVQQNGGEMNAWEDGLLMDRPTPAHTPQVNGQPGPMSDTEKRALASHVHQLYYNQNRVALAKAISQTVELLKQLQEMNAQWPAHYPSVQKPEDETQSHRPGLHQAQSTIDQTDLSRDIFHKRAEHNRPAALKRAGTSLGEDTSGESSGQAQARRTPEPRLITPQIAQEFSILKLDLKVGTLSQTELVHSLEKKSIASLLDGKIGQSVRHLLALRDRIEDTSSKVLVTGDLNAGKSTFCNALLRRKILPEDQQPCTSIFCEVLDAKENGGHEEVHAVHKDAKYDRNDESTYDAYSLDELEKIVIDNDRYMQCKVYVKDVRTIDQSLLNNGVVDIALIDAPGLNADSVKTTAVFARQEEIDVVVFVVSAANHFTLSAKEFIWQAAHEKAYMFMVVNGFDNIRDKERCQKMILDQLAKLSPQTFKEAQELVHFVSSNAVPTQRPLPIEGADSGGGGSGPSNPPDDDDDDDGSGKGKGKDKEKLRDFEVLESALRRFVLEKRARSKLAPAKTYLMNCLGDMNVLATVNRDVAQAELERVSKELSEIEPEYVERQKQRTAVSEQVEKDIDSTATDVYNHTRSTLSTTIANVGKEDHGVEYPGLFSAFQYADDLRVAMLDQISAAVTNCETYGRSRTVHGVSMVKALGLLHVGEEYDNLNLQADKMFQRRKDALVRSVDTDVELWDFFDVAGLWERQEKTVGTGLALTLVGTVGSRAVGGIGWIDGAFGAAKVVGSRNLRRMIVPGVLAAAVLTVAYVLSTIPQTLPPRLATKLSATLAQMDYTHSNANRIAAEVRRVLRYPAQRLTTDLAQNVEELRQKKEDVSKVKRESEVARKYFGNLVRNSSEARRRVAGIDLEGPPGAVGAYA